MPLLSGGGELGSRSSLERAEESLESQVKSKLSEEESKVVNDVLK